MDSCYLMEEGEKPFQVIPGMESPSEWETVTNFSNRKRVTLQTDTSFQEDWISKKRQFIKNVRGVIDGDVNKFLKIF